MIAMAIGFAIINFFCKDVITILSTAITGSYMTIRGISFIIGGFPSEFLIYTLVSEKAFDQVSCALIENA